MKLFFSNSRSDGFTLFELLVAIAIFGLIAGLAASSKFQQSKTHVTQLQAVEMQQSARSAMLLMKKELRMAGFNPFPDDYDAGIEVMTANSVAINAVASDNGDDDDGDGVVDEEGELENVSFVFEDADGDGNSEITVAYDGGGAQVMAENIQSLIFTYFDEDGNVTATADDVKSIQIDLTVGVDVNELEADPDNATRTLTTTVYLRNMGL